MWPSKRNAELRAELERESQARAGLEERLESTKTEAEKQERINRREREQLSDRLDQDNRRIVDLEKSLEERDQTMDELYCRLAERDRSLQDIATFAKVGRCEEIVAVLVQSGVQVEAQDRAAVAIRIRVDFDDGLKQMIISMMRQTSVGMGLQAYGSVRGRSKPNLPSIADFTAMIHGTFAEALNDSVSDGKVVTTEGNQDWCYLQLEGFLVTTLEAAASDIHGFLSAVFEELGQQVRTSYTFDRGTPSIVEFNCVVWG